MHPGVLVAKVGYFGVKSAKVLREQMAWAHQHLLKWVRAKHAFFLIFTETLYALELPSR